MTGASGPWGMGPNMPGLWQSGPSVPPLGSCTICGAAVFMADAERHTAWHEMQEGGEPIPDLVDRLRSERRAPSLRDEVRDTISDLFDRDIIPVDCADAVLAVVRRHVESLSSHDGGLPDWVRRSDVLRLLEDVDD